MENDQAARIAALEAQLAATMAKLTATEAKLAGHGESTATTQERSAPSMEQRPGSVLGNSDNDGTSRAFAGAEAGTFPVGNAEGSGTPPGVHQDHSSTSGLVQEPPGPSEPRPSGPTESGSPHAGASSPARSEEISRLGDDSESRERAHSRHSSASARPVSGVSEGKVELEGPGGTARPAVGDATAVTGDNEVTPQAAGSVQSDTSLGDTKVAGTSPGVSRTHSPPSGAEQEQPGSIDPQPSGSPRSGSPHAGTSSPARSEEKSRAGDDPGTGGRVHSGKPSPVSPSVPSGSEGKEE